MPVTKAELLQALKDPGVLSFLRAQMVQNATVVGIGRYPGQGSAQNDNYVYPDAADANFPYNFDYEIPGNFQRIVSARLSFKIRPYRTYSSLTLAFTGTTVIATDSTAESGHSHNHSHTITFGAAGVAIAIGTDAPGTGWQSNATGAFTGPPTNTNAAGSSGHSHSHNHGGGGHSHTVSGTTTLGIAEDAAPVNPAITVAVDGVDYTAKLGGPFNADMTEIDVTQVLQTSAKVWHVMSLQPNQRVRLTGILRISYLVDSRVAQ